MPPVPYLPLADIAKVYRISVRTARNWARHDRWRHTGTRPIRYHLGDAQQSYEQRHHGRVVRHLVRRYGNDVSGT